MRASRREAEPLRIDEGRQGGGLRLEQRDVGETGNARVEAVHDVEAAVSERGRDARPHPDGDPDRRPRRDRNCPGHGDDVIQHAGL